MSALLDRIKAQRAEKIAAGERPVSQQITVADISIKGSGLTKREALRNTNAYEREAAKAAKADVSEFVANVEEKFQQSIEETMEQIRAELANKDIIYDDSQLRAIAGIIHNKVSVLIGAAGTGKTTVTKEIVRQLIKLLHQIKTKDVTFVYAKRDVADKPFRILLREALEQKLIIDGYNAQDAETELPAIAFAAYTGRATQQIKRALPKEYHSNCSTIHSLLGYAPVFEDVEEINPINGRLETKTRRIFRPTFCAAMKLPYRFIVIDEGSMVPIPLWNELIDALPPEARIIIIGDIHQLPPVYGKSVLGYAMRKWPVFELTTIHRQAAGNAIISNAHNVLHGKMLDEASNFHLIGNGKQPSPSGSGGLQKYFLQVVKKLSEMPVDKNEPNGKKRFDPIRDAIIVPQNKDMVGSVELNAHFVTMFNPEQKINGIIVNKRMHIHTGNNAVYFATGDKVMITSNINTVEPPITNGMVGLVESININGKYDMKRSQVDFGGNDESDEETDEDNELAIDLDNMKFALEAEKDEKEKAQNDETADQRQSSHVLTIKFENGQSYSCSTAGDYRRITHGYAATCHKSQGGEYPNVIILCHSVNARMLSQEWLYTAITRARDNVYVVCNERGLTQALTRQVIKGKTLKEKIQSYIIETKSDDEMGFDFEKYPILWEPKEL